MIVLGIDPGTYGGVAFWRGGAVVQVADSPTTLAKTGRQVPDLKGYLAVMQSFAVDLIVVEQQWAQRENGKLGVFAQGYSYGAWCMAAVSHGCHLRIVSPQRWKAAYAVPPGDKDAYRRLAAGLWPHLPLSRKKDGHRADAALIAAWGASTIAQSPQESRRAKKRPGRSPAGHGA